MKPSDTFRVPVPHTEWIYTWDGRWWMFHKLGTNDLGKLSTTHERGCTTNVSKTVAKSTKSNNVHRK